MINKKLSVEEFKELFNTTKLKVIELSNGERYVSLNNKIIATVSKDYDMDKPKLFVSIVNYDDNNKKQWVLCNKYIDRKTDKVFITLANTNKIIFKSDINALDLDGEIYKIKIYFLSRYEENALLAIKELLKDPENYFNGIYQPYEAVDTFKYVYEGQQPAYHKYSDCPRLKSDYEDFEIPSEIKEKGVVAVQKFREWFKTVKYLLEDPEALKARIYARWGIDTNSSSFTLKNSGLIGVENLTIEEFEKKIDGLIKEAGRFYYKSEKNKEILKRFSKYTYLADKKYDIYKNNTGYSDDEVRELLRYYEDEYKRPLKRYLIQYYSLKFNPEIKMEGYFLEKLGFKACGHCYDPEYEPKE